MLLVNRSLSFALAAQPRQIFVHFIAAKLGPIARRQTRRKLRLKTLPDGFSRPARFPKFVSDVRRMGEANVEWGINLIY